MNAKTYEFIKHKPDDQVGETLARNVVRLRGEQKLTQGELSTKSTVTRATLVAIESGEHNPRLDTILMLAQALGVETWQLLKPFEEPPARVEVSIMGNGPCETALLKGTELWACAGHRWYPVEKLTADQVTWLMQGGRVDLPRERWCMVRR